MAVSCISAHGNIRRLTEDVSNGILRPSSSPKSKHLSSSEQRQQQSEQKGEVQQMQESVDCDTSNSASSSGPEMYVVAISRRGGTLDLLLCSDGSFVEQPLSVLAAETLCCIPGEASNAQPSSKKDADAPEVADNVHHLPPRAVQTLDACTPLVEGDMHASSGQAKDLRRQGAMPLQSRDTQESKPYWLLEVPVAPFAAKGYRADRQNLWMPLCWLPHLLPLSTEPEVASGGSVVRTLLAGRPDGSLQAWRVSLDESKLRSLIASCIWQHWKMTHPSEKSSIAAQDSGQWTRLGGAEATAGLEARDRRADAAQGENRSEGSWHTGIRDHGSEIRGIMAEGSGIRGQRSEGSWHASKSGGLATVKSVKVYSSPGHSSLLFTLHITASRLEACTALKVPDYKIAQSCEASHSNDIALELWSTSLDRKLVVSEVSVLSDDTPQANPSKQAVAYLATVPKTLWHCTGALVTAMTAVGFFQMSSWLPRTAN
jgi:hypothetical protein